MHLDAVYNTIPYFFMAGRINYARYTSVYLSEMRGLENNVPEMFAHMQKRGFVVRRSEKNFNSVPTDQALEQSINREAKSNGGVIGYTLRRGSPLRWLLTRRATGEYAERVNDICSSAKLKKLHEELGGSRIKQDQQHVQRIKDYLED